MCVFFLYWLLEISTFSTSARMFYFVQESCTSVAWSRTCTAICPNWSHPGTGTRAVWPPWTWMGDSPTWSQMPSTGWVRWNEAAMVSHGEQSVMYFDFHVVLFSLSIWMQLSSPGTVCCTILQHILSILIHWWHLSYVQRSEKIRTILSFISSAGSPGGIKEHWFWVSLFISGASFSVLVISGNHLSQVLSSNFPSKRAQFEKMTDNYGQDSQRMGSVCAHGRIYYCNLSMSFTSRDENKYWQPVLLLVRKVATVFCFFLHRVLHKAFKKDTPL